MFRMCKTLWPPHKVSHTSLTPKCLHTKTMAVQNATPSRIMPAYVFCRGLRVHEIGENDAEEHPVKPLWAGTGASQCGNEDYEQLKSILRCTNQPLYPSFRRDQIRKERKPIASGSLTLFTLYAEVYQGPKGWEGTREWSQGERPYLKRPKGSSAGRFIRGSLCSRCSNGKGCRRLARQPPFLPLNYPKG